MKRRSEYVDEPAHKVRTVGRSVGLPAFRNTNRPKPLYKRKANALARRRGFRDLLHMELFTAMIANLNKKEQA